MGGFYGSIHIRTDEYDLIKNILQDMAKKEGRKFYLGPVINGWVGVFPDNCGQDDSVSLAIAKRLEDDVLHLVVHDDDIFCYWYYRNGKLIDKYNSLPDYFGEEIPEKEIRKLQGQPEVFAHVVDHLGKIDEIREILEPGPPIRDRNFADQVPEEVKEFAALAEETQKFIKDPKAMQRFLLDHPELFENEFKNLSNKVLGRSPQSMEEVQEFVKRSGEVQSIAQKLVIAFMSTYKTEHKKKGAKVHLGKQEEITTSMRTKISSKFSGREGGKIQPSERLFSAREQMGKFAGILGISNAVTSYEYLADGETNYISNWEQFVEIS
jgi:hypothetical protein